MSPNPRDVAREWLDRQIAELGKLRNAGTRAPEFKAWRQNTLTMIQRIWPGDQRRSERFRRIPFRPPGSPAAIKMDDRGVREAFERGCGEAGVVLRQLVGELTLLGIEAVIEPTESTDAGAPTLERGPEPEPPLHVTPAPPVAHEVPRPVRPHGKPSRPVARTETPKPAARPSGEPPAPKPELHVHAEPPAARPAPRADVGPAPTRPAARPAPPATPAETDVGSRVADFLSASPVFAPRPGGLRPPRFSHTAASEMASIAAELEDLGVPAGRRKKMATALMELAHMLDAGEFEWSDLRDAVHLVMEHPAIACRALPHLLPLIQTAA